MDAVSVTNIKTVSHIGKPECCAGSEKPRGMLNLSMGPPCVVSA